MKLFPGQVEEMVFNLDQVKVLASSIRNQVFWAFTADEPVSTSDVARDLGKSAQTVHYHVNELSRVGLIVAVAERKRRARTEKLYVRTGYSVRDLGGEGSAEYNFFRQKAFAAMMRTVTRESALMYELMEHDRSVHDYSIYRRVVKRLSHKQAQAFIKRMEELIEEITAIPTSPEEPQVHVVTCMRPTMAQSRHWAEKWGVEIGKLDAGPIDDDE